MEKLRDSDEIINFLKTLGRLGLLGPKSYKDPKTGSLHATPAHFKIVAHEVLRNLDLSGKEWDDDYDPNRKDT